MTEKEAIEILIAYNLWRIGDTNAMLNPQVVTEAINTIIKEYKKRNL